jgi:hypothetical protein
VEVVGHEDEGVELVAAFGAVFIHQLEEEVGVGVGLEEAAAIGGNGGYEEGADFLWGSLHESRLERGVVGGKITPARLGVGRVPTKLIGSFRETRKARG